MSHAHHHILYQSMQHGLWEEQNGSGERKNNQFPLVYNILFYELLLFSAMCNLYLLTSQKMF